MDLFKLRQVYKSWFNLIDILKRWRFLNDNTDSWYTKKMRRRVFKSWKNQIRLKHLYFAVNDKHVALFRKRTLDRMMAAVNKLRAYRFVKGRHDLLSRQRIIRQWYSLLGNRHLSRFGFRKKRTQRILHIHFKVLEEYKNKKVRFREGMKRLLKMRAQNLMRRAYVRGLKQIWHQKVIEINMWKASGYLYRSKLLKRPFRRIARIIIAKRNGKIAAERHIYY